MEMQISEVNAQKFWQDQVFRDMFSGCKCINAVLFSKGQHIFLTPQSVSFEKWGIELDADYAESLAIVVEIIPRID